MKPNLRPLLNTALVAAVIAVWPALSIGQAAQGNGQMDAGSSKMMSSADARFAMTAAQGGMAEVQLGQLAAQKATNPQVKEFGQMMVDDHTKANDQLKSIAAQENMTLPASLDGKDSALLQKLQNQSGDKFDRDYINAMVKDHEKDIKQFQKEAQNGKDSQMKNFASTTLPTLQTHLEKAKAAQSSLGGK